MKTEYPPLPVLYAFQDSQTKKRIQELLSKEKISRDTAYKIVDIIFKSKEAAKLREQMQDIGEEGVNTLSKLPQKHLIPKLTLIIRSILEDL